MSFYMNGRLVDSDGRTLNVGDKVKDFRNDEHVIEGWSSPRHSSSTGRVHTNKGTFFPSVVYARIEVIS